MAVDLDRRPMLIALAGATAISFSPVLFIYSDTNPSTGAFFRMLYALPALALLAYLVRNADTRSSRTRWLAFGAGLVSYERISEKSRGMGFGFVGALADFDTVHI